MSGNRNVTALLMASVVVVSLFLSVQPPSVAGQGTVTDLSAPVIVDVTMSLSNISGTIVFRFAADGTCPPGADHVNVSFGAGNGTSPPEPLEDGWIGPVEMMFFGNGISLRPTGPQADPWSTWSFRVGASLPEGTGFEELIGLVGEFMGNGTFDLEDLNWSLFDPELVEGLEDMELYLFARAYMPDGSYGQTYKDMTDDVVPVLLEFARSEGLIDGTDGPEGPGDGGEGDDGFPYGPVLIALLIIAEMLFLVALIYIMRRRKARRDGPKR